MKWHLASGDTPEDAYRKARELFLGVFHEAVLTGGRSAIEHWAQQDTRAIGWRRVSDGDPCAFCAMLVTRTVYTSAKKAGLRASDGKKYHPHCGCTVEVVYGDWEPTQQEQQWIDEYYKAAESLPERTPRTAQDILPIMRRNGAFRDSRSIRGNQNGARRPSSRTVRQEDRRAPRQDAEPHPARRRRRQTRRPPVRHRSRRENRIPAAMGRTANRHGHQPDHRNTRLAYRRSRS